MPKIGNLVDCTVSTRCETKTTRRKADWWTRYGGPWWLSRCSNGSTSSRMDRPAGCQRPRNPLHPRYWRPEPPRVADARRWNLLRIFCPEWKFSIPSSRMSYSIYILHPAEDSRVLVMGSGAVCQGVYRYKDKAPDPVPCSGWDFLVSTCSRSLSP